jgi:hypothetical protein
LFNVEVIDLYIRCTNFNRDDDWLKLENKLELNQNITKSNVPIVYQFLSSIFLKKNFFEANFFILMEPWKMDTFQLNIFSDLLKQFSMNRSLVILYLLHHKLFRNNFAVKKRIFLYFKLSRIVVYFFKNTFELIQPKTDNNSNQRETQSSYYEIFEDLHFTKKIYLPKFLPERQFEVKNFHNCLISGTGMVIKNKQIFLLDRAAHPKYGFISGNWPYLEGSNLDFNLVRTKDLNESKIQVKKGFDLLGRNTPNYFHSLLEYVPKLLFNYDKDTTLIISSDYPQSIKDIIDYLNTDTNSILQIPRNELLKVKKLVSCTLPTSFFDNLDIPFAKSMVFDSEALVNLRVKLTKNIDKPKFSNRILLHRGNSFSRHAKNFSQFENHMTKNSFQILSMHNLNFKEQINAFYYADVVVGIGGAHFANVIFSKPSQKVFLISSPFYAQWPGFQQLCDIFGLDYYGIAGYHTSTTFESKLNEFHSDFVLPKDCHDLILDKL